MYPGGWIVKEGNALSLVVDPSARETFTPRELVAAYKEFTEHGPQHQGAETGLSAAAYRFGERVLIVYEESEASVVVLTHPSSYKVSSQKIERDSWVWQPRTSARRSR
jgi:hypothetical protein